MSDTSYESLSAIMDAEASDFELRRLVDRTGDEPELLAKWSRYHLAAQLRQGGAVASGGDLLSRVQQAIADEQPLTPVYVDTDKPRQAKQPWWKPVASMAVAASVTAVVILGGQQFVPTDSVDPSLRQSYTIPSLQTSDSFVRAGYGNTTVPVQAQSGYIAQEPEVIRLSQGLNRYINQHQHMLHSSQPQWTADWLPDGFVQVRHEVLPQAEVMLFSNGKHSVSVSIEAMSGTSVPVGVTQGDGLVALGLVKEGRFVTVVGDVPLMVADRIADSLKAAQ